MAVNLPEKLRALAMEFPGHSIVIGVIADALDLDFDVQAPDDRPYRIAIGTVLHALVVAGRLKPPAT